MVMVLVSIMSVSALATPFNDSVVTFMPELSKAEKTIFGKQSLRDNYSIEKQGMFVVRPEPTTIPSLYIGYGGIYQVFAGVGRGLISGANYAMIGYRSRLFGGYKWGMGFEVRGGISSRNLSAYGLAVGIDLFYSYKNFDFKCLGLALDKEGFEHGDADLSIGVCYNFRSKKYWDYKLEQYEEQMGWEKSKGYDKKKSTAWPSYNNTHTTNTPCPTHFKYGPETYVDMELMIDKQNDGIVGIYEDAVSGGYELAVIKHGSSYRIIYLSGGTSNCWKFGHVKADLRSTATPGLFKATWYLRNFLTTDNCVISFDGVRMEVVIPGSHNVYLKMYPEWGSAQAQPKQTQPSKWYGTGWAIGNEYLVTNNHVAGNANTIIVKGVDGDFNVGYTAEVVATDPINDIAILWISDYRFKGFGQLPYGVSSRIADVGENVFVMGYPMMDVLGNELKLTNGIINSRSGAGEVHNCYQIQAPITNGNSGGPVFDDKGNVIGIVVSGLKKDLDLAENVGYAIKTPYLKALIENKGLNIKFPNNNSISTLSLAEKKKRIEKYVLVVECSK